MRLSNVSDEELARIRAMGQSKGVDLREDSAVRTYMGITFHYEVGRSFSEGKRDLSIDIIHKPWFLPESRVEGWIVKELASLGA